MAPREVKYDCGEFINDATLEQLCREYEIKFNHFMALKKLRETCSHPRKTKVADLEVTTSNVEETYPVYLCPDCLMKYVGVSDRGNEFDQFSVDPKANPYLHMVLNLLFSGGSYEDRSRD